jgi:hypothetical protein
MPDIDRFAVIAPLSRVFKDAASLEGTIWRVKKAAENRDVPRKGRRGFINAFY